MNLVLLFLMISSVILPQKPEEIILKAEAKIRSYQTLQADFIQMYFSMSVSNPLKEKGRLFFQKPDRMRWEYFDPEKKVFVSKENSYKFYFPEENQLMQGTFTEGNYEAEILQIIAGKSQILDTYSVEFSPFPTDQPDAFQLKLTPKKDEETLILLEINEKNWLVQKAIFFDWAGNKQEYHFSNITTDIPLPPDIFQIQTPPDVEIVESLSPSEK